MAGTVKKMSDGRYHARFTIGSGVTRVRHTKIVSTERRGRAWLRELESANCDSTRVFRNCYFVDYFKAWFRLFKAPVVSMATAGTYKLTYQHLKMMIPKVKLTQLNRTLLQSIFNQLGRSYSKETCRKHGVQIKACLRNALYDGLISRDLMTGVVVTGNESCSRTDTVKYLSGTDFQKIRSNLFQRSYGDKDANYLILAVISATGARVGEVIGLKWPDLDVDQHQLRIQRSFDSVTRRIKTPKTSSALRTIPLIESVVQLLVLWHKTHCNGEFIFAADEKSLPKASSINSAFHTLQRHLGIEPVHTTHTLRHTMASLLVKQPGLDVTYVSHLLGHSNPGITQKYYLRVLPNTHKQEDELTLKTIEL